MARIVRSPPRGGTTGPARAWRDPALAAAALTALALWLAVAAPAALGQRTFFLRDVFGNHLPLKYLGAQALARGEVPAFTPALGLGQPFRGNPSALAFYPGNALYLVLPFWSAFNLHYALHWLLAALAMIVLARELGQRPPSALLAGITYGGSGVVLSCLTYYNVLTVLAWWPLAMAGVVRGGRRGIALGGLACGLALLGGEPQTAALALVPLVLAAVQRHGSVRGLATAAGIGVLGTLVALPQLVATLRIFEFSFRGDHGASVGQVTAFTLPPLRLLELVLPLPLGWPLDVGPRGWWAWRTSPEIGYFLSFYAGIVGLWLVAAAIRKRPIWAALAAGGLLFAWLWGAAGGTLAAMTGGIFRFPERFMVWWALAVPLLAGWGLGAALERPARPARAALWGAGLLAAGAAAIALFRPTLLAAAAGAPAEGLLSVSEVVDTQTVLWIAYLVAGATLLALAAMAVRRRLPMALVALQLAALAQLFPLVRTTPVAPFRTPPAWLAEVGGGAGVFHSLKPRPMWEPPPRFDFGSGSRARVSLQNAADLEAVPGVFHGLTYPLWPDMEGLSSPLYTYLTNRLPTLPWPARVAWLRALGVDAAVVHRPIDAPDLVLRAHTERWAAESFLYAVRDPAPAAWWPDRLVAVEGPVAALGAVPALADPVREVVVVREVGHRPGGRVTVVEELPDRVVLDVVSGGGLAVVRRSFHTLYRARAGDRELPLQPAQMTLVGIEVPPGEHRVVLDVDDRPETAAMTLSALAALAALGLAWKPPARLDGSSPAGAPGPGGPGPGGPGRGEPLEARERSTLELRVESS